MKALTLSPRLVNRKPYREGFSGKNILKENPLPRLA
jgi:hypothetical protein